MHALNYFWIWLILPHFRKVVLGATAQTICQRVNGSPFGVCVSRDRDSGLMNTRDEDEGEESHASKKTKIRWGRGAGREGGPRVSQLRKKKLETGSIKQCSGAIILISQLEREKQRGMEKKCCLEAEPPSRTSNKLCCSQISSNVLQTHISPVNFSNRPPQNALFATQTAQPFSAKPASSYCIDAVLRPCSESSLEHQIKKIQSKVQVFQQKISESAEPLSRTRQKGRDTPEGRQTGKFQSDHSQENDIPNYDQIVHRQSYLQYQPGRQGEMGKRQQKRAKKWEKSKVNYSELNENSNQQHFRTASKNQQSISPQIVQYFLQKYPYYLLGKTIVYPIEDSLFITFPELKQSVSVRSHAGNKNHYQQEKLSANFSSQLQIWNILREHPAFFELRHQISIEDVPLILKNQKSSIFRQLFKAMHLFYIKDVTNHKYDESSAQQHYSFISLWKYADENNILDKIFVTCWNKLIELYINIYKNSYSDAKIKEANEFYAGMMHNSLQKGKFNPPENYNQLLSYILFLINMCFQTHTFRNLINDKMLFFRDNNKMKNELLQQKKDIESLLWDIKEQQKQIAKKQKTLIKTYKKEQKTGNTEEETDKYNKALSQIENQKNQIIQKREAYLNEINSIQNNIYELSCMPEFSNVWFIGQDRYRNLYWFIKGIQNSIFKETIDGRWSKISNKNIDLLQNTLNLRGIRQKKLHEKITYYKQLGYLKTVPQGEQSRRIKNQTSQMLKNELMNSIIEDEEVTEFKYMTPLQIQNFSYLGYRTITDAVIKILILKSQLMMTKYLFQRNSKWTTEENRQLYLKRMSEADLDDLETLTQDLRMFNEKICVVQINIKACGSKSNEGSDASKTRKIQTKIWGINQKYKHFWYDYSRRCKNKSDLYFLVSILYLTIQKYVTKTRKPNNTKYFFKTVQFGDAGESAENYCGYCQNVGELHVCSQCDAYMHLQCLTKHESTDCAKRKEKNNDLL